MRNILARGAGSLGRRPHVRRLRHGREAGVALVEFALVLPLLALFLFGMIEFGKAFNYWIDETHLANTGARFAVVNKNPGAGAGQTLQQYIAAQADSNELRNGGTSSVATPIKVCITFPSGGNVGNPVVVTTFVDYNWLPFIGTATGLTTKRVSGKATMRIEVAPTAYSTAGNPPGC